MVEQSLSRTRAQQEQGRSRSRVGQEQGRSRRKDKSRSGAGASCFLPISAPVYPNGLTNSKLKDFAVGRFWPVGLVGQKIAAAILNSFYVVFWPISDKKEMISQKKKEFDRK